MYLAAVPRPWRGLRRRRRPVLTALQSLKLSSRKNEAREKDILSTPVLSCILKNKFNRNAKKRTTLHVDEEEDLEVAL